MSYEILSLKKGLRILDLLKINLPLSLTEIQQQLQLNKTTTFRLLYTLESMDYVLKIGNYYMIHPSQIPTKQDVQAFSWSSLRSIADFGAKTGHALHIGILKETTLYAEQVYDGVELKMVSSRYALPSLAHQTALGKVIVAHLEPQEQHEFFSRITFEKATDETLTDPYLFTRHLEAIQSHSFATDLEEANQNLHCIAVPIFYQNKVIASLGISDHKEQLPKKQLRKFVQSLKVASQKITEELTAISDIERRNI